MNGYYSLLGHHVMLTWQNMRGMVYFKFVVSALLIHETIALPSRFLFASLNYVKLQMRSSSRMSVAGKMPKSLKPNCLPSEPPSKASANDPEDHCNSPFCL